MPSRIPSVAQCKEWLALEPDSWNFKELLRLAESGEESFVELPMRAFAVGDKLGILALPSEMYCEYQLHADATSPFDHTIVSGYTNGSVGYIATKKDYELPGLTGGHGVSPATAWPLQPSVEELINDGITRPRAS